MELTDHRLAGLPDPDIHAEFYDGVLPKRLLAWIVDVMLIWIATGVMVALTLFTGLLVLIPLYLTTGFLYRWMSVGTWSATPGMLLSGIELRDSNGRRLDPGTAFLHVAGYTASVIAAPAQFISAVLMAITPRGQGLTDLVLGTTALRRGL